MGIKHLEDGNAEHREAYEWKSASITVSGTDGDTDITEVAGFTTLFDTVPSAHYIELESAGTAYWRLNASTNDKITTTSTTPYTSDFAVVRKLYVSTGSSGVTVTVKLR